MVLLFASSRTKLGMSDGGVTGVRWKRGGRDRKNVTS